MAGKDLEQMVLDDGTIEEMAEIWYEANADVFDEAGIDPEDGWAGEPPEELDQIAEDAAADIVDQLRSPEDGSGGIAVVNPIEDIIDGVFFKLAELTAATPEDYEAWMDTLEAGEDEEGDVEDPLDDPEAAADAVEGDEEVDVEGE
jgi:hypothetical protein